MNLFCWLWFVVCASEEFRILQIELQMNSSQTTNVVEALCQWLWKYASIRRLHIWYLKIVYWKQKYLQKAIGFVSIE